MMEAGKITDVAGAVGHFLGACGPRGICYGQGLAFSIR